ncbi:hypothetical protein [Nocardia arizonensis]|uniref:hypothetical protein n=1 Tax=Nocardia arizonensis TaxID=1141647 RepID=UPI0006D18787|nr:hypothetical protein [Nocardia arizonensis]
MFFEFAPFFVRYVHQFMGRRRAMRPQNAASSSSGSQILRWVTVSENFRAPQADYLGHADPGFTSKVYAHLLDDSHERARLAVVAAWKQWAAEDCLAAACGRS